MSNENPSKPRKVDGRYPERPRCQLPFQWPACPPELALVWPQIPPNTGNVSRLCAATNTPLHLVKPYGFEISDAALRRAGLDYWDRVRLTEHDSLEAFRSAIAHRRYWLFSTAAEQGLYETRFEPGDVLILGNETTGLPREWIDAEPERCVGIPQLLDHVRCINLSSAAAVVLYEALRQLQPPA